MFSDRITLSRNRRKKDDVRRQFVPAEWGGAVVISLRSGSEVDHRLRLFLDRTHTAGTQHPHTHTHKKKKSSAHSGPEEREKKKIK